LAYGNPAQKRKRHIRKRRTSWQYHQNARAVSELDDVSTPLSAQKPTNQRRVDLQYHVGKKLK
jgi:hypothetical protein